MAHFRTTKAAVKMHTLLDLRGNIPSFIHISDGKLHDVHALDMLLPEAGAIYVVDRGYVDFARLYVLHQAGAFSSRVPSRTSMLIASIRRRRIARPASFATRPSPWTASTPVRITPNFCGASAQGPRVRQDAGLHHQQLLASGRHHLRALQKPLAGGTLLKWIKQHLRIKQFYGTSENAVKTQIWIAVSVYVLVAIVKTRLDLDASLYTLLQILSVTIFEKMPIHQALAGDEKQMQRFANNQPLNLFDF